MKSNLSIDVLKPMRLQLRNGRAFSVISGDLISIGPDGQVYVNDAYVGDFEVTMDHLIKVEATGLKAIGDILQTPMPYQYPDHGCRFVEPDWEDVTFETDRDSGVLIVHVPGRDTDGDDLGWMKHTVRFDLFAYLHGDLATDQDDCGDAERDRFNFYNDAMDEFKLRRERKLDITKPRVRDAVVTSYGTSMIVFDEISAVDFGPLERKIISTITQKQKDDMYAALNGTAKNDGGDNKTVAHCKAKFPDNANFRGYPYQEGAKKFFQYADGATCRWSSDRQLSWQKAREALGAPYGRPLKHEDYPLPMQFDLDHVERTHDSVDDFLNRVPMLSYLYSPCGDLQLRTILDDFVRGVATALGGHGIIPECKRDGRLRTGIDFSAITASLCK